MRTPKATIITAATYCCAAVVSPTSGFLQPIIISPTRIRRTAIHHHQSSADDDDNIHHVAKINNNDNDDDNNNSGPLGGGIGGSEAPRSLGHNRSFLGIRRESGIMRRMMLEQQKLTSPEYTTNNNRAAYSTTTALSQSATALMPDGGLSPCVIKVLGVGGGGSNAVRFFVLFIYNKCNVYYYLCFYEYMLCVHTNCCLMGGFESC